jgi:hypothetical protein
MASMVAPFFDLARSMLAEIRNVRRISGFDDGGCNVEDAAWALTMMFRNQESKDPVMWINHRFKG